MSGVNLYNFNFKQLLFPCSVNPDVPDLTVRNKRGLTANARATDKMDLTSLTPLEKTDIPLK